MATAAVNLAVPAPADDSMEMSSPARHDLDEDIDFDDWQPEDAANDTDRMMEDGEQTRPATATDDVMEDDLRQGEQTSVQEEEMQDSPSQAQQIEDEDLIDYSDDEELPDEVVEDAVAPTVIEQPPVAESTDLHDEDVREDLIREPAPADLEQPAEDQVEATVLLEDTEAALPDIDGASTSQDAPVVDDFTAEEGDQIHDDAVQSYGHDVDEQHLEDELEAPPVTDDAEAQRPAISLDTSAPTSNDGPATPTDTGLHAMTLRFGDLQCPLFKSRNQPDGLLKNDNLASLSLGELIQNCRQRLAVKTGDALSEDQDLVLGFDQLGLMLVEDSRAAFECSLEEVLDVYLQLHRNDQTEDIPPFSLNLSLRLKFTSSISVLKQAAAGGSGLSSFGFEQYGEEEHIGGYDQDADFHAEDGREDFDEAYQQEETEEGHGLEHAAPVEGSIPEHQEDEDTNDQHGEYEAQQIQDPEQEEYHLEHEEHYEHEPDHGQYYEEEDDDDEAPRPHSANGREDEGDAGESADIAQDPPNDQVAATEDSAQASFEASAVEAKTASTATSTTLQGDDGPDTTDQSSPSKADYSTLLTEPGDDAQADFDEQGRHEQDLSHSTEEINNRAAAEDGPLRADAQDFGSEDYPDNYQEQQFDEADLENGESYDVASGDEHEAYGQEYDQTDDKNVQQDETALHTDGPGEEDEQFSTAYELFDEGDAERHGPEDEAPSHDAEGNRNASAVDVEPPTFGDDDDFIDFDLDDEPPAVATPTKAETAATGSRTPLAKRSYEELAGDDVIDFDSPEPKKARAS